MIESRRRDLLANNITLTSETVFQHIQFIFPAAASPDYSTDGKIKKGPRKDDDFLFHDRLGTSEDYLINKTYHRLFPRKGAVSRVSGFTFGKIGT